MARWLLLLGIVDQRKGKVYDDIFKELEEIAMNDETLRDAFQSWETLSATPDEILAYQARLKLVLDEEAAVREAELREQDAKIEGEKRGEQRTKERTARNLLSMGLDVEKVIKATELDEERVLEIQREMLK